MTLAVIACMSHREDWFTRFLQLGALYHTCLMFPSITVVLYMHFTVDNTKTRVFREPEMFANKKIIVNKIASKTQLYYQAKTTQNKKNYASYHPKSQTVHNKQLHFIWLSYWIIKLQRQLYNLELDLEGIHIRHCFLVLFLTNRQHVDKLYQNIQFLF